MLHAISSSLPVAALRTAIPAMTAILFGVFVVYGVGFAAPATIIDINISHIRIAISRRSPCFPERGYASNLNPTLQKRHDNGRA